MSHVGIDMDGASRDRNFRTNLFHKWSMDNTAFRYAMSNAEENLRTKGTLGIDTSAAFNAKYGGPYIYNLAYNAHNALSLLPIDQYIMGLRYQFDLSLPEGGPNDTGVILGGYVGEDKLAEYATILMPYKLNQHNISVELGYEKIESEQDVVGTQQRMEEEIKTYNSKLDRQILYRIEDAPPIGVGSAPVGVTPPSVVNQRVGYESIERIISNSYEAQFLPGSGTGGSVTPGGAYAQPYWTEKNLPSDDSNFIRKYRDKDYAGFSATSDNNFNAYVDCNYKAGTVTGEADMRQLEYSMIDGAINAVMPWHDNNDMDGSAFVAGYDTSQILSTILQPMQRYTDTQFFQITQNGISTMAGRPGGFNVNSYRNVPIFLDRWVGRGDKTDSKKGVGRMYLIDGKTLKRGVKSAPTINNSANPIMTGTYRHRFNWYEIGEVQAYAYRTHGKIIHCSGLGA